MDTIKNKPQNTKKSTSYKTAATSGGSKTSTKNADDAGLTVIDYSLSKLTAKNGQMAPRNTVRIFSVNPLNADKYEPGKYKGTAPRPERVLPKFATLPEALEALQTRTATLKEVCGTTVGYGFDYDNKRAILIIRSRDNISKTTEFERACNGLVLDTATWSVVSQPPNYASKSTNLKQIKKHFKDYKITRLEDGTCVTLYHYEGEWCMSSASGIDISEYRLVFPHAYMKGFLDAARSMGVPNILKNLDTNCCYTVIFRSRYIHPLSRCTNELADGIWLVSAIQLFDTLVDKDGVEIDKFPREIPLKLNEEDVAIDLGLLTQETVDVRTLIGGSIENCINAISIECNNSLSVYMETRYKGINAPDADRSPISSALASRENSGRTTPATSDSEGEDDDANEVGGDGDRGLSSIPMVSVQKMYNPSLYKPVYGYMFTYNGNDLNPNAHISIKLRSHLMRHIEQFMYKVDVPLRTFSAIEDVGNYVLLRAHLADGYMIRSMMNSTTDACMKIIGDSIDELKNAIVTMLMRTNREKMEYISALDHPSALIVSDLSAKVAAELGDLSEMSGKPLEFNEQNVDMVRKLIVAILRDEVYIMQVIPWIRAYSARMFQQKCDLDI